MNGLAKIVVEANDKTFNFSQDAITKLKKGQKYHLNLKLV